MKIEGLDELDNRILEIMSRNARLSYSEIGEQIGLSRVAVKNRIENLENQGVILGYKVQIAERNVKNVIQFFIDIETEPGRYNDVIEELSGNKMLKQIYAVTGSCKIIAIGYASNARILQAHTGGLFKNMQGVKKIACYTVLAKLKDTEGEV